MWATVALGANQNATGTVEFDGRLNPEVLSSWTVVQAFTFQASTSILLALCNPDTESDIIYAMAVVDFQGYIVKYNYVYHDVIYFFVVTDSGDDRTIKYVKDDTVTEGMARQIANVYQQVFGISVTGTGPSC
jgi:hypothetical protein